MAGNVGVTPVHLAAAFDHLDVTKALIDNEGDPEATNQHGFSTIFEVLHSPFIMDPTVKAAIIIWILQQQHLSWMSTDYQGNSILGWFTQHHPKGVKLLLDHNAEVDLRAHGGATALHKAVARACGESVRLLMDSGADLAIIEMDGSTALVRAAKQGCLDVLASGAQCLDRLVPVYGLMHCSTFRAHREKRYTIATRKYGLLLYSNQGNDINTDRGSDLPNHGWNQQSGPGYKNRNTTIPTANDTFPCSSTTLRLRTAH